MQSIRPSAPVAASQERNPCFPRKKFATEKQANLVAMKMNQKRSKQVYVEPCSKCNGWHVAY